MNKKTFKSKRKIEPYYLLPNDQVEYTFQYVLMRYYRYLAGNMAFHMFS